MAMRKAAGLNWAIVILLSLISLLFTLITLLSGLGGHSPASYLTIDTTNLALPAKLSSSVFLQDLSKISGSDLVGQSNSRQTLGLSSTYSVSLLTACGRNADGSTTCFTPHIGFTFNPGSYLKLDRTAAQGTLSTAFYSQLHTYAAVSTFVAVAYILASLLTIFSCLSVVLSRRYARALVISRISSAIAATLTFAATVASIVTFIRLRDAFNIALSDIGVKTATNSGALALSVVASVASIAAFALVLFIRPTSSSYRGQYHREKQDVDGESSHGEGGSMSRRESRAASMNVGFLERVPTWKRPRYAQIQGKKLSIIHSRDPSPESDRDGLIDNFQDDVAHGGFERENGYSQSMFEKSHSRQNLDRMQTAYKPNAP